MATKPGTMKAGLTSLLFMILASCQILAQARGKEPTVQHPTFYRIIQVDGVSIFYREAGPKDAPTILLLHGVPSSSRMFEPLFSRLADSYHLVAPDYPGFGHSDWPDPKKFTYTFDHCAEIMNHFTDDSRPFALHALHAGLRRTGGLPHGLVASSKGQLFNRAGCSRAQRRPGCELEDAPRVLGRSRRQ